VLEILPVANELLNEARTQLAPRTLILHTCRFAPHSKGDDTRSAEQVAHLRQTRDPLTIHAARLDPDQRAAIHADIDAQIAQAFQQALADPFPQLPATSRSGDVAALMDSISNQPLPAV
jgi:pyruvate dehydrogenase E1 component alpha subunit